MVQRSAQEDVAQSVGESISAAVDGEINDLDLQRVLKQSSDEAVRDKWRHSHLIGAVIRGELNERNTLDISAGVFAALEDEAPLSVSKTHPKFGNVFNLLGKSAVAASVALAVLVGVRYMPQQNQPANDEVLADASSESEALPDTPMSASLPAGFDSPRVKARVVSTNPRSNQNYRKEPFVIPVPEAPRPASDPKVQAYLNHLLLIHAEQSSQASVIGVLPYVRVLYPANRETSE